MGDGKGKGVEEIKGNTSICLAMLLIILVLLSKDEQLSASK